MAGGDLRVGRAAGMSPEGFGSTEAQSSPLVAALRRILRPLLRLFLSHRLTFPFLSNLLKEMYVEVALAELAKEGRKQTDSQVSVMTGVHRKDVRRFRESERIDDPVPITVSRGGQLALRWITSVDYQDEEGQPLALPLTSADPKTPSFEALAHSISKDIRPRVLLDELIALGVARIDSDGRAVLRVEGFVPEAGFAEKAFYFGRSVRDHVAAASHNLDGGAPPFFERCVSYGKLSPESVRELQELWNQMAMDALRAVNRRGAALQKRDTKDSDATHRVGVGGYFFAEREEGGD